MILNDNTSDIMNVDLKININIFKNIELALEKIGREMGEDEYGPIFDLKINYNILITNEEIKTLNGRRIWIWIIVPFNKDILDSIEKKLISLDLPLSEFIKIIEANGQKYIKYPESKEICAVHKDLSELLSEEHEIKENYLKCYEWEHIQNSELWRKAEIQIARELIAYKLINKFNICDC